MRITPPKPFFFKAGKRAVLLLHGFTGSSADVRMLGRFLQDHHYTCFAPQYKGHGISPDLLLQTGPSDWWQDVLEAYHHLKERGYTEIAVCGLSLGGVFSLKLGFMEPVTGIIPMNAPLNMNDATPIKEGYLLYVRNYKKLEGKTPEQIEKEIANYQTKPMDQIAKLKEEINHVASEVDMIYAPIMIVQGKKDTMIDVSGAKWLYDRVQSNDKELKWYEKSGHAITIDQERKQLQSDILAFLNHLNWHDK